MKNNNYIKTQKNHKATFFYDKEKPYMKLEFDFTTSDSSEIHAEIHKIDLSEISFNQETYQKVPYVRTITFNIESVDKEIYRYTDITKYKEMTLSEIEKELGYKIKIKS